MIGKTESRTTPCAKKTRYSDEELQEFKSLIEEKIEETQMSITELEESLLPSPNGIEDKDGKEDSHLSRDLNNKLLEKKKKLLNHQKAALVRISNKTFGVDRTTGKLIALNRLRAVPHATLDVETKNQRKEGHSR